MAKTKKHQLAVTDKKTLHQNLSFVAKEQYLSLIHISEPTRH